MVNAFFNANDYLAKNKDLVAAGLHTPEQLWEHYVTYGAQENAEGEVDRAPNSWFDVNYYLGNYPDLVAAGITAGQALNHYFEYGINEGRSFNPVINASQFDAETYAEKNPDVREHYGIAEGAELTAADKADLLKHYLSYGYAEGREGAGDISKEVIEQNDIKVHAGYYTNSDDQPLGYFSDAGAVVGTIANDEFTVVEDITAKKVVIDGLAGNDTIIFERDVAVEGDDLSDAVTLRNIENVEVVGATVDAKIVSKLDSLKLSSAKEDGEAVRNADVALLFADALVAGSNDVLNVEVGEQAFDDSTEGLIQGDEESSVDDDSTLLVVNGFETVNLALDAKFEGGIIVVSSETQGADQTVVLSGAEKDAKVGIYFENEGSPELTNLTIDASGLAAQLAEVALGVQVANVANITIKGSTTAANDIALDEDFKISQTVTVVGGDKDDTITATTAIDVFTGGKGEDTFVFALDTAAVKMTSGDKSVISAVDTITDFKKGDKVEVAETALTDVTFVEAKTGEGATLNSLDAWVKHVADDVETNAPAAFNFGGDAYILLGNEGTSLIKLAGVDAGKLDVADGVIVLG